MAKNMEAPFVFGVRVEGDAFTDRREETARLKANFTYGVNTILISPRRMGKTSLVDKVLRLPEVIAQSKGYRIVVCIDEFQQIGDFLDSLTFQKKLRGIWQLQSHVSYCLYGSKKHMMEQMFQNQSYPFYRFGDFFYLNKADASSATSEDVQYGIDRLLDACESLFIQQTEDLSAYQMNFLHALVNGVHTGFTQSAVLSNYRLGTAANITRLKKALIEKDLVTITSPKHLEMSDPILALWLKKRVWKE